MRGALVGMLALVIFAPVFATVFAWTAPGRASIVGLAILVLTFSAVALVWPVAVVGGAVGLLLHGIASRRLPDDREARS
jgi:hypothetical protein